MTLLSKSPSLGRHSPGQPPLTRGTRRFPVSCRSSSHPWVPNGPSCARLSPMVPRAHASGSSGSSHDADSDRQEAKLGPGVVASVHAVKEGGLKYSVATVMRNDAVNLEGTIRLLHLTVCDPMDVLYGRKVRSVIDHTRWIDAYTMPGQFVCLRLNDGSAAPGAPPRRLFSIASSPYESKRDSAYVDGCIIEVVAERGCSEEDDKLAALGPGSQLEVSQVIGRGFSSLLNSYVGLLSSLEESRNLLIIAVGTNGMVPARSALRWTPVQAHGTAHKVTCLYVAHSASNAAFLSEWDTWRDAGVDFKPLYTSQVDTGDGSGGPAAPLTYLNFGDSELAGASSPGASPVTPAHTPTSAAVLTLLDRHLFGSDGPSTLEAAIGGKASEVSVLLSGCSGELASKVTRKLVQRGVAQERVLYCEYF